MNSNKDRPLNTNGFTAVYAALSDLNVGLRTRGDYQVAAYVERAISELDAALRIHAPVSDLEALVGIAEKQRWSITPQVNGGWIVETADNYGDDGQEREIARMRKSLSEALWEAIEEELPGEFERLRGQVPEPGRRDCPAPATDVAVLGLCEAAADTIETLASSRLDDADLVLVKEALGYAVEANRKGAKEFLERLGGSGRHRQEGNDFTPIMKPQHYRLVMKYARSLAPRKLAGKPNWSLAMDMFCTGSTFGRSACAYAGVDPNGYSIDFVWEKPGH